MRVLALAPHTDDAILGAGGYIVRLLEERNGVSVLAFSIGNDATGSNEDEFKAALTELGVGVSDVLDFETRHFGKKRQVVLHAIEDHIWLLKPDLILAPARHDHQDHVVVYEEACRAVRSRAISLLGYEHPWSQLSRPFHPRYFVKLSNQHILLKQKALSHFVSQKHKRYMRNYYTAATAARWGPYVDGDFAEAFEVFKWTT